MPKFLGGPTQSAMSWCPSVRMFVCCMETRKCVLKLFLSSGSLTILVYPYEILRRHSDGVLGASNADDLVKMKNRHFRPIFLYLGNDTR